MGRGGRLFVIFLIGCFIVLASAAVADASIELRIDGRVVPTGPALTLLGSGLGLARPILEQEFGFVVDDSDFPVVALLYGDRLAVLVVDDGRAVLDGRRVELQAPPRVSDGVLFVPLHLIAEIVGLRMNWDVVSGTLLLEHRPSARAAASLTVAASTATTPVGGAAGGGAAPAGLDTGGRAPDIQQVLPDFADAPWFDASSLNGRSVDPPDNAAGWSGVAGAAGNRMPSMSAAENDAADPSSPSLGLPGGQTLPGYRLGTDVRGLEAFLPRGFGPGVIGRDEFGDEPPRLPGIATVRRPGSPAVLQQVGISLVNGRVRLEVGADRAVEPRVMFLPNPERLVVDVPNAVLATGWRTMEGDGKIVAQVRASATEDGGVRLVADLTGPTGYKLRPPERGSGFIVEMNHQLNVVSVEPTDNGGLALHMTATGRLDYKVFPLREPDRIVIDVAGASVAGPREMALDQPFASSVRISQYEHDVVRAVVELKDGEAATRFSSRLVGGVEGTAEPGVQGRFSLVIHPSTGVSVQRQQLPAPTLAGVGTVAVFRQGGTEFVLIEADAPLSPKVRRFREPERLVLDLPGVALDRSLGLTATLPADSVVRTVRAGQVEPTVSRIVVETARVVEHHLFVSPDGLRAVLALRGSHLGGRTVVVDPGHGGRDPGAIGYSGTYEKDVTLAIGLEVARLLQQAGATVVMTRHEDVFVELANRSALANAVGADAFVSIHADAIGFGRIAGGTSTFYFPEGGGSSGPSVNQRYAASLQGELLRELGLADRGVHQRAFHVVRNTTMPSALVEVGFIDNPDEEKLLVDPEFQARAAAAIVHGILRFFAEQDDLAVPTAREQWKLASEQAVRGFLRSGEVPGGAIALVPMAVFSALPE